MFLFSASTNLLKQFIEALNWIIYCVYIEVSSSLGLRKFHSQEKDDLEARFSEENESAERASSQELERTRKQANEALKAMDNDRQQLRSANNK